MDNKNPSHLQDHSNIDPVYQRGETIFCNEGKRPAADRVMADELSSGSVIVRAVFNVL